MIEFYPVKEIFKMDEKYNVCLIHCLITYMLCSLLLRYLTLNKNFSGKCPFYHFALQPVHMQTEPAHERFKCLRNFNFNFNKKFVIKAIFPLCPSITTVLLCTSVWGSFAYSFKTSSTSEEPIAPSASPA